jgi:hypothetical protein
MKQRYKHYEGMSHWLSKPLGNLLPVKIVSPSLYSCSNPSVFTLCPCSGRQRRMFVSSSCMYSITLPPSKDTTSTQKCQYVLSNSHKTSNKFYLKDIFLSYDSLSQSPDRKPPHSGHYTSFACGRSRVQNSIAILVTMIEAFMVPSTSLEKLYYNKLDSLFRSY